MTSVETTYFPGKMGTSGSSEKSSSSLPEAKSGPVADSGNDVPNLDGEKPREARVSRSKPDIGLRKLKGRQKTTTMS